MQICVIVELYITAAGNAKPDQNEKFYTIKKKGDINFFNFFKFTVWNLKLVKGGWRRGGSVPEQLYGTVENRISPACLTLDFEGQLFLRLE